MLDDKDQLERLLSERPDGALSADERLVVERALREDPSTAKTAGQYERLQAMLRRWRAVGGEVDWEAMARRTSERVAEAADQDQYRQVDGLVQEWADSLPDVDWDRFKLRVAGAVREEATRLGREAPAEQRGRALRWTRRAKWIATVGVPLAAAAVIVIAVWWPGVVTRLTPDHVASPKPLVVVSVEAPRFTGNISIDFDRSDVAAADGSKTANNVEGGLSLQAGGVAIANSAAEHVESVDEALFY